ncbi:MAG: hypothetical protein EZS28_043498, partial [Streblomastix strix]
MLVSSLVTQSQQQEVRDIATGKSKAYVFSTQGDNVITTLGAATRGGNAITDISIDGNVLTPAKNKNFVDTEYDQSISGQKKFNTTIHSVGITVQTYDNSSVVCAGGGVRSIADIYSASYSKSEDNALLVLKADKSTTSTKTEDNALLLPKADKSTTYTKIETNNLLNNKADTGVSNTKGGTNNLLNNKADTGVSYTKGEDDALLLLKAVKSTTYTKTQDDVLLLLKADKSTTYTKTEDDALLLLKADKTQLIDSYTKGTSQTITANKTFNNACRFTSTIEGMSTITGSSYVKSGADNTVVLLGAGGTKPIAEFGGNVDDSNYVKKTGYSLQV